MIRNETNFKQSVDFSKLPSYGQDVDYFLDFGGDVFVGADFKYNNATLTEGQRITVKNLVKAVGKSHPIFFAVAQHDDEAPNTIDAGCAKVAEVYYSYPSLNGLRHHVYAATDDHILQVWIATVAVIYAKQHKLNSEAIIQTGWYDQCLMSDPVFAAAWASPEAESSRARLSKLGLRH